MQMVLRGKCVRKERTTGRIRGTKAKEENERLRCEIKDADCEKGQTKCMIEKNVKRENKGLREKIKGTRAKEKVRRLKEEVKLQKLLRVKN